VGGRNGPRLTEETLGGRGHPKRRHLSALLRGPAIDVATSRRILQQPVHDLAVGAPRVISLVVDSVDGALALFKPVFLGERGIRSAAAATEPTP
jgi:hypothetical protein